MDCLREKASDVSELHTQEEERERLFYPSVISDLSIHIRCMMSLWEGIIDSILSGVQQPTNQSSWSFPYPIQLMYRHSKFVR